MNSKDSSVTTAGVVILFIVIIGAFISGGPEPAEVSEEFLALLGKVEVSSDLGTFSERGQENSENRHVVEVDYSLITRVSFTLTWTDEPDQSSRFTNGPDTMTLGVESPAGASVSQGPDQSGSITVTFDFPDPVTFDMSDWLITVTVGDCGDQEPLVSIFGLRTVEDDGNTYSVGGEVTYYTEPDLPGSGKGMTRGGFLPEFVTGVRL